MGIFVKNGVICTMNIMKIHFIGKLLKLFKDNCKF